VELIGFHLFGVKSYCVQDGKTLETITGPP
jgi:hypothetical protein